MTKRLLLLLLLTLPGAAQKIAVTIGPPQFTGAGLDDAVSGGTYTGVAGNHNYTATLCTSATPDTVQFSREDTGTTGCTAVTGFAQPLTYPAGSLTTASWSGGRATFTDAGHPLVTGSLVTITGVTPSGYNVTGLRVLRISSTQFSVALVANPGSWVSGGTVLGSDGATITYAATTGHTAGDLWVVPSVASGTSADVGFIHRVLGAVFRPAQEKLRDIVSVKDFGGTDTQALQGAIDALIPSGGTILMPAGSYSLCAVVVRNTGKPITISAFGAILNPTCANQWMFTLYGNSNKILGAFFVGVGGIHYEGIYITADTTTQVTLYNQIQNVYMFNMWRGIWDQFSAVTCVGCAAYRTQVSDSHLENFYLQKTWVGSFGISFDGDVNGNSGGNDSKVHGVGVKGYVDNIINRNSVALKIEQVFIDGGASGILYDGGSSMELDHIYFESNTDNVTTASTLSLPYLMIVLGGTQANFTNCVNGAFLNGIAPTVVVDPSGCFLPNIGIIGQTTPGVTQTPVTNEFDLGPFNLGSGQTDMIGVKLSSGNWRMDFSTLNTGRDFTFYRPGFSLFYNSNNLFADGLNLKFGVNSSSHFQFPFNSGQGSTLHSNGGAAGGANGLFIASNELATNTTGGDQANAALPSWAIDLGGYDNGNYADIDSFSIWRKPAAGAYAKVFSLDAAGTLAIGGSNRISSTGMGIFSSATTVGGALVITNGNGLISCTTAGQAVKAVALTNSGNTITISATCAIP